MDNNVFLRLKNERLRLHLGQSDVANATDVSLKTVQRWEKEIAIPSDKLALLEKFGADVQYIVTGKRSENILQSDETLMLEKYRLASLELRNKILMLLLGSDMASSKVNNRANTVNGQQIGNENQQTNNFNDNSSVGQSIDGDVKIKVKGKKSQAAFNISNNDK